MHIQLQLNKQWCLHLVLQEAVEEKSAKQEKDEMIMGLLLEEVLPKATTLYMAGPLQVRPNKCQSAGTVGMLLAVRQHRRAQRSPDATIVCPRKMHELHAHMVQV
jgi:hypothetical protein